MICEHDGAIVTAHCKCKAGLGETCSHVAAVLFYIEIYNRLKGNNVDKIKLSERLIANVSMMLQLFSVQTYDFHCVSFSCGCHCSQHVIHYYYDVSVRSVF